MRRLLPACAASLLLVAGCSTSGGPPEQPRVPAQAERIDAAWIARNGPSNAPREGWVNTASGWKRSGQACLRFQEKVAASTGALAGEGCLEPGI